ncbi:HAMP domain-containing sensor histidine kinase [Pseudomonas sp. CCI3.2]|uniref:sensor histidine kinase n=1 Tax=unclassified Pseudomonas TaxID=196821 RepID=UPI002AC96CD5|nr:MULTISPECIES: HAMP domain-containing sensor histidine kinase [unclassified Pseudomonas]MEB0078749.1 HAMP domain-containing sensor histidine kinase [Pseudomonas sp. MH10out]MEB0093515.1 HAMP domain-containing sensor histidine kinase [Pseudomonas sp. CCI4.2]MEB0100417.1 HAMP domain-containing sensor histidine kinase [Pseudomonas sp. CCI3.2]MEB0129559.1 HAMP domain-containing sensor histidine kinase [Pseudomonas sp. CCI2.4]MEB0157379.1 HAMP domain-containing sensor histidine kinase [Pseudomona
MSLLNPSKGWRSSSSRLLALYSFLFVAWSGILMGVLYWEVTGYLSTLARHSLTQRQHLFARFQGYQLIDALNTSEKFDMRAVDAYGLFDSEYRPIRGPVNSIPANLPLDGKIHELSDCIDSDDPQLPQNSCDAVATQTHDGRWLILVRDNGSLFAVTTIIWHALLWAMSLTIIPGVAGWHLLRRRPLRRIRGLQASAESIVAGDLARRLPVSDRRDELDMLAVIVNAMLDRIEKLMNEVKGVCDNIAHDLRTPLTRLRAQLYRIQQQSPEDSTQALQMGQVIAEADTLMARFRGLLRISELEDHQRRSGFVELDPRPLLHELYEFYLPVAEEAALTLDLRLAPFLPTLMGDRALLFEALANLLSNAIKFSPLGGVVILSAYCDGDGEGTRIEIQDSGPGIPVAERDAVFQRFYRCADGSQQSGFGLGLSIVAAIVNLHGFKLHIDTSPAGGANLTLECRRGGALA